MSGAEALHSDAFVLEPHAAQRLDFAFFRRSVVAVARDLIGAALYVDGVGGQIVETEAYHPSDPASHSFRQAHRARAALYGPIGHAYLYRAYGLHWCFNIVCGLAPGSAVLIRALRPLRGLDIMRARRHRGADYQLCAGPGQLCQALGITRDLDGAPLDRPPFALYARAHPMALHVGQRIGISRGTQLPWRFCLAGSAYVSRSPRHEP